MTRTGLERGRFLAGPMAADRRPSGQGSALTGDPAFRNAAKEEAQDLKISTLERINDQRRRALIALQARIETDQSAQALNSAIWDELRASTERRRVTLANF